MCIVRERNNKLKLSQCGMTFKHTQSTFWVVHEYYVIPIEANTFELGLTLITWQATLHTKKTNRLGALLYS